jgi:DNA polymerase-3 subunit alpha
MNELYADLLQYLDDNFISYEELGDFVLKINDRTYELFEPIKWDNDEKGILFDEEFHWACDLTDYDYYIFRFGSIWYSLEKGKEKNVKLERVKWIGKARLDDELFRISTYIGIHGPFELMNGVGLYDEWCKKAKFLGITSLGLCEKGTLAAAMKFQNACQKAGLRAIQGLEIKILNEQKDLKYTVKAFVKNSVGWSNLLKLNEIMNTEDSSFVSEEELEEYCDGLVFIWDPKTIAYKDIPKNLQELTSYYQLDTVIYEKNNRDREYLDNLKKFFKSDLKPVAMCDAYYIEKEWSPIKDKLNKLGKVPTHESHNQYFKNYQEYFEELSYLFSDDEKFFETFENAISNLEEISFECNFVIETQVRHMPIYRMTDEEAQQYDSNVEMFEDLIFKGLEEHPEIFEKYSNDVIGERLEREMKIIEDGEVADYFLTLRDIVNWCRKNDILLGTGRGSSAGSLITYLLGLTHINPLDYDLLFERFLTTGRLIRHDKVEEVIINENDGKPITIKSSDFVRIFRGDKKMIVKAGELQEGDKLVDYDND